ncbi:mitochondrial import receptor subunit TOM22 homolog [Oppia nitens]|uniref:mitochondrial import receptor subunit TOM22 homolog n=1 Tax=Oppia nitens TaxID=1686743 RepID=UPI0023D9F209|nr:mitochondrial import receptor subunit TOM22 homolog [Oppia nitens]
MTEDNSGAHDMDYGESGDEQQSSTLPPELPQGFGDQSVQSPDSGIDDTMATSPADATIPAEISSSQVVSKPIANVDQDIDDDDDFDETLVERLIGLTEMFPETLRNLVYNVTKGSLNRSKQLYGLSCSVFWVVFTSSAVLLAPLALEMERSQLEEINKQQQRQILLGPSAAISGGGHGMPMPPLSAPAPR